MTSRGPLEHLVNQCHSRGTNNNLCSSYMYVSDNILLHLNFLEPFQENLERKEVRKTIFFFHGRGWLLATELTSGPLPRSLTS